MSYNKNLFQEIHYKTSQITQESFLNMSYLKFCLKEYMGKRIAEAVDKHMVVR